MGYLLAYSLRFILTWCESYIPASCLAYVQLDILGKRTGEHQASQCVRKTFRMSAGVIAVARETHQSESRNTGVPGFKGLWQSRHQIWESWYRHHACTQKAVASSMSCSLQTFCWGCRSHCRLWQCFGQGLSLKNICTASAKASATDRCIATMISRLYLFGTNRNTFAFPSPGDAGSGVEKLNWHLFSVLFACLFALPNSH